MKNDQPYSRELKNCGFVHVRQRAPGEYFCIHCEKTMPPDWHAQLNAAQQKQLAQQVTQP